MMSFLKGSIQIPVQLFFMGLVPITLSEQTAFATCYKQKQLFWGTNLPLPSSWPSLFHFIQKLTKYRVLNYSFLWEGCSYSTLKGKVSGFPAFQPMAIFFNWKSICCSSPSHPWDGHPCQRRGKATNLWKMMTRALANRHPLQLTLPYSSWNTPKLSKASSQTLTQSGAKGSLFTEPNQTIFDT